MAAKKSKQAVPKDEKFEQTEFVLFEALAALDKKDYLYYDRLTAEQRKKFVPFMMTHWMSSLKGNPAMQEYYIQSTQEHANIHLFDEHIQKHPKLQWLLLCAISPGLGKQFHNWIPHIKPSVAKLKVAATLKDITEYYAKLYPKASDELITEISSTYVDLQKRKLQLAKIYPNMKLEDIDTLNQLITDDDIKRYERDSGNT
tara:strand:+ start:333 stop:935 length:603 start_codon:yes stop_codon:yes gene_type:complete